MKHNMDEEALQSFLKDYQEKILPMSPEYFPDMKASFWVKGIGTDNKGSLAGIIYYESLEDFRKYYNKEGTPTEKGGAAYGAIMPVFQEMMEQ